MYTYGGFKCIHMSKYNVNIELTFTCDYVHFCIIFAPVFFNCSFSKEIKEALVNRMYKLFLSSIICK